MELLILVTLIAGAAFFVYFILASGGKWFSQHKWVDRMLIALSLIVFLGSETLMILNEYHHFGMKSQVTVRRTAIQSVVPASGKQSSAVPFILLRRNIGKDPVYLYVQQGRTKLNHSGLTDRNRFETTTKTPYLLIQKKQRVFKNRFYHQLFSFSGQNHVTVSVTNVFYLPARHQVMTVQELKRMQKAMKKQQAEMQKAAQQQAASHSKK
ncbi:DUF4811 domain-containing protein [Sporolactobacillus vineae]|uniref:DUF4811 domain-containing protein n=1 Tax=Sporolactobacillus vineae TaxID=444463 RepID=UPI001EE68D4C|nr:DUF4811 domain-containing protein [Sporolactobacillus vineae]